MWHIDSLFVVELRSTLAQIWMDILGIRFIGVGEASKFTTCPKLVTIMLETSK